MAQAASSAARRRVTTNECTLRAMNEQLIVVGIATGAVFLVILGTLLLIAKFHRRVGPSEAFVVTMPGGARVARTGVMVFPVINSVEVIDLTTKTILCACKGRDALGLRDGTRVDVGATFAIRVGDTQEDILKAAKEIGAARIRDAKALEELFAGRFARAIADVVRGAELADLERDRDVVEEKVIKVAEENLQGMVLERVVIARVEPTPAGATGPFR